ncbi:hypothetical protein ABPG75_009150 [Micractinium tetrahymenae]
MTTAAALRSKLFGQGSATAGLATSSAGPHTTEALRQATDRLLKEQASAELSVGLYRQKLVEAHAAVKRLEEAYVAQNQTNAKLQARVKSDYSTLSALSASVTQTSAAYRQLKADYDALAVSLGEADLERGALAAAFAAKAGALAEVEAAHGAACAAGRDLQGRLDASAAVHSELVGEVGRLRCELADKARLHEAAEGRVNALAAELASAQRERDELATRLGATTAQAEQLRQELTAKGGLLEEVQGTKAALELAVAEHEGRATQLAANLAGVQEAAKSAEVAFHAEHVLSLPPLLLLQAEHTAALEAKAAELAAAMEAKAALEEELANKSGDYEKLSTQFNELQEEAGATQAAKESKLAELQTQLDEATQRHSREMKQLLEKHERDHESFVERTGQKLSEVQQEKMKAHAELEAERKAKDETKAAAEELRKKAAEMEAEHAAAKMALQSKLEEQAKQLAEALAKAAAADEEERKHAAALAAAEAAHKVAQELATQRATQLDELASNLKEKEEANAKLDKENAANLHKLDTQNDTLRSLREKLESAEARTSELAKAISAKERELEEAEAALTSTQQRVEVLEKDNQEKARFLTGISQVAAHVAGAGTEAAAAAGGSAEGRGRSAAGRAAAGAASGRPMKKVTIREPADLAATSEGEESSGGEDEPVEEANPHQALVPAGGTATRRAADRRPPRAASQRPAAGQKAAAPAPASAPSRPIITEVDSDEEAEEPEKAAAPAREAPAPARAQRAAAAAAAAPMAAAAESDDDSEDEGRQVRGRKRSGRANSGKSAGAAKKPRGGMAVSGMRGLFSMQTASQGASDKDVKKKNSGRGATTSGYRKLVGGGGAVAAKSKKPAPAASVTFTFNGEQQKIPLYSEQDAALVADMLAVKEAVDAGQQDLSALELRSSEVAAGFALPDDLRSELASVAYPQLLLHLRACALELDCPEDSCNDQGERTLLHAAAYLGDALVTRLLLAMAPVLATAAADRPWSCCCG